MRTSKQRGSRPLAIAITLGFVVASLATTLNCGAPTTCLRYSDCASGLTCADGLCVVPPAGDDGGDAGDDGGSAADTGVGENDSAVALIDAANPSDSSTTTSSDAATTSDASDGAVSSDGATDAASPQDASTD
jgi:hypothetical protein